MSQPFEILLEELVECEEFRQSFLSNPLGTLRRFEQWDLPLTYGEVRSLITADRRAWRMLVDRLAWRLNYAAA